MIMVMVMISHYEFISLSIYSKPRRAQKKELESISPEKNNQKINWQGYTRGHLLDKGSRDAKAKGDIAATLPRVALSLEKNKKSTNSPPSLHDHAVTTTMPFISVKSGT